MNQQGLLLFTGAVRRVFERIGALLRIIADGVGGVLLGVRFPFERVFPHLFLARITGHGTDSEKGGTK